MPDSPSRLPAHPSLTQLQKRAKELLKQLRAREGSPLGQEPTLAEAQFALAREYGFENWAALKHYVEAFPAPGIEEYEQLARELAAAYAGADVQAVRALNWNYSTAFVADFHEPVEMQRRLPNWFAANPRTPDLSLADAQQMVAHAFGFSNWGKLAEGIRKPAAPRSPKDWEAIFALAKERGDTSLQANGIDDAALQRLTKLPQITHLRLQPDGLTDEGLMHLASMPQLVELEVRGSHITDRGLAVLRDLPLLRRFQSCWTPGISDVGVANFGNCERLESVDLLGTATGDGLLRALAGKPHLRHLKTGRAVTDAGIKLLREIPAFRTWSDEETGYGLMSAESRPNHLLIDGPFTDRGLGDLAGLDGLFGLSFFWHSSAFTSAGLAALQQLPKLGFLGCEGVHCDDEAMRQIAALPRLRMLMAQGAVASDDGWEALAESQTVEYIWGRGCPHFTGRGLAALARMPKLRGIGISCKQVDDASLAKLASFPALRELVPMDVPDNGFRHVGRCANLEALWCMYCRNTTDCATEHIQQLSHLKTYYAGMTQITDRSLEMLSRMTSLECVEFSACTGITDAGIRKLADLPRLRELTVSGSPGVTATVASAFRANVRVKYSA